MFGHFGASVVDVRVIVNCDSASSQFISHSVYLCGLYVMETWGVFSMHKASRVLPTDSMQFFSLSGFY